MAPIVHRLRALPSIQTIVYVTAQHRQMLNQVFSIFGIQASEELDLLEQGSNADGLQFVDLMLEEHKPDCVLIHGSSSTAVESSYLPSPAGNMEAGLCMHELRYPDSAATGRRAVDLITTNYFVPSEASRDSLLRKGVAAERIFLTDSIVVDALLMVVERIRHDDALRGRLAAAFPFLDPNKRLIFVNAHGHENHAGRLESICRALKRLAMRPDVQVIYPVHHDTQLNGIVDDVFANHPSIALVQPQDYLHFVYLMQAAYLILTDLGDPLKEALSLSKPVLVLRDVSERPATVDAGTVKLVGTETERILRECTMFLDDPSYYRAFSTHRNPYGDGHTSQRIVETLLR